MTKILFGTVRICPSLFKRNYLRNQKHFSVFLFLLWNLHQILRFFQKKKIVIGNVLSKLQTVKDLFRALSKKRRFRTSFENQHVKGSQRLLRSTWEHFYDIFSSLQEQMIWKISPLLKLKILGAFVKTLTANDKYPVWDCEN